MRYVYFRTIRSVEERVAKRWISGVGENAKFENSSRGWYALFVEEPSALFLGNEKPAMMAGDKMRITAEVVS